MVVRFHTALVVIAGTASLLALMACGGDGDELLPRVGGGTFEGSAESAMASVEDATGSDVEFVIALCQASGTLRQDVSAAATALGRDYTSQDVLESLAEPMRRFRDRLEQAPASTEVAEYQADLLDAVDTVVAVMESGDLDAVEESGSLGDLPAPPLEIRDRLEAIAADLPECADVELFN